MAITRSIHTFDYADYHRWALYPTAGLSQLLISQRGRPNTLSTAYPGNPLIRVIPVQKIVAAPFRHSVTAPKGPVNSRGQASPSFLFQTLSEGLVKRARDVSSQNGLAYKNMLGHGDSRGGA